VTKRIVYTHLKVAETYAQLSYAKRLKVGAIVVKDNRVISIGYNGTPSGWSNECEFTRVDDVGTSFVTKPEVIHAEANAIAKLARSQESGENADMYITHAPCIECAKLIFTAGIKKVYYKDVYRNEEGLNFLRKCGIVIERVEDAEPV
jgi:dCMP deaminase